MHQVALTYSSLYTPHMPTIENGSAPQHVVDRAKKFLDTRMGTFRDRNEMMETAIARQLGVISQLPTGPVKRDEDFLREEGLLLQKALGLIPGKVSFIDNEYEADLFLRTRDRDINSPWAVTWDDLHDQAYKAIKTKDANREGKYHSALWDAIRYAPIPSLGLSPFIRRKTNTRLLASAQSLIVEAELSVYKPFQAFVNTATQGAYILCADNESLKIFLPKGPLLG